MDELTAAAGLTRGALYHGFGDKKGLLAAVIAQIDAEAAATLKTAREGATDTWSGLLEEGIAYIGVTLGPEFQRIMLLDGPAVLGAADDAPAEVLDRAVGAFRTMTAGLLARADAD